MRRLKEVPRCAVKKFIEDLFDPLGHP